MKLKIILFYVKILYLKLYDILVFLERKGFECSWLRLTSLPFYRRGTERNTASVDRPVAVSGYQELRYLVQNTRMRLDAQTHNTGIYQ